MAAETEISVSLNPHLSGVDDLIGQLRRTGAALEGLADSLQALSDGGPDTMRSVPDKEPLIAQQVGVCPWVITGREHNAHRFQIDTDTSKIGAEVLSFECPGHPVRPWHPDSRTG